MFNIAFDVLFNWIFHPRLCKKVKVQISYDLKSYGLYMRGREVKNWGNVGAFRYGRMQLTVEICFAHDHTGDIHKCLNVAGRRVPNVP